MESSKKYTNWSASPQTADMSLRGALLDEVAEGVFVWDRGGRCKEVNRSGCSLLGYEREDILGMYFLDLIHKDDLVGSVLNIDNTVSRRQSPIRAFMQRKDGMLVPVEIEQRPLADGNVVALVSDMTPLRKAEEQIRNMRRLCATLNGINHTITRAKDRDTFFESICEIAVDRGGFRLAMVCLLDDVDPVLNILSWKSASVSQPSRTTLDIAIPPLYTSFIGNAVKTGKVTASNNIQWLARALFPEVEVQWFASAVCIPIHCSDTTIGVLVLGSNDSGAIGREDRFLLKEIEESFSSALEAFALKPEDHRPGGRPERGEHNCISIMDQLNDAVLVLNADGKITFISRAVQSLIGYIPAEMTGNYFGGFLLDDDRERTSREFRGTLESGKSINALELRLKHKGGYPMYCEIDAAVYKERTFTGLVGVVRDVSRRKKAEEESRIVEIRRREMERQMQQAQRLGSLGTLAGGIAQDFNNLLGIIMGYCMLLRRKKPDYAKLEKELNSIQNAAERGAILVKQLLTIGRRTETVFSPVNVNEIVNKVVDMSSETFPETISISKDLQDNIPTVIADSSQLQQVLMNLAMNSRDAMPMGGTLSIATKIAEGDILRGRFPEAESLHYVVVQVADNGTGMSEDTRRKLFDPFFTTKMPGKGTGLGLALVYSIMEGHRGWIEVQSEEGEGTIFNLYLPVDKSNETQQDPEQNETEEIRGGKETIFVVEDEEMLQDIMQNFLAPKGYTVLGARDGEEALRIYSQHPGEIDLVVLDLGLPKIGGEQVIEKIRSIRPKAKVVIASGFVDTEAQENLLRSGVLSFIPKPYSLRQVLATVRKALDSDKR